MEITGFITQASYRIIGGVPVVHLFGRLENNQTFLVRDTRQTPHFYVESAHAGRARGLAARRVSASNKTNFAGVPVDLVEVANPRDAPPLRNRLHDAGITTYEADVRFAVRYLIDRNIRGSCKISGEAEAGEREGEGKGVDWVFVNPDVVSADWLPKLSVLAFDIETDFKAEQLLAISLYGCGADEVFIFDPEMRSMPEKATGFDTEYQVLEAFCQSVQALDPDILTGWNVIDFDLTVLAKVAKRCRHPLQLGRLAGDLKVRAAEGYFGSGSATIPGRVVLDGIDLLRGAFIKMDDYSLDGVSRSILGEGKALHGSAKDRVSEIMHDYKNDLPHFAQYARTDSRLVIDILNKLELVDLSVARSRLTGMTPDRVSASIASFDFLYLSALVKENIVAPSVRSSNSKVSASQTGGHVLEPVVGLHKAVWVFDFQSLYPSIIRTFNIDPLAYRKEGDNRRQIRTENGAYFERTRAILPQMLDQLFPERAAAKAEGNDVASQAIKILMNSCYGVLGTPACRFHNPALANAITSQGKVLLLWAKNWFEQAGYQVLYGDTDSLFVGAHELRGAKDLGVDLSTRLNTDLSAYIQKQWSVESCLVLEFEKLYEQLILPSMRGGVGGARKRYVGVVYGKSAPEFVGMEVVRRDWTELAKQVQRELYTRLFAGENVQGYLFATVAKMRAGELNQLLVYRKGLRKPTEEYTANTPPHVAAARKLDGSPGRIISYVITSSGPEPVESLVNAYDYEHYLEKQIKPVAVPVLEALGLDFDHVIGDDTQLGLF